MKRRNFIKTTTMASAGTLIIPPDKLFSYHKESLAYSEEKEKEMTWIVNEWIERSVHRNLAKHDQQLFVDYVYGGQWDWLYFIHTRKIVRQLIWGRKLIIHRPYNDLVGVDGFIERYGRFPTKRDRVRIVYKDQLFNYTDNIYGRSTLISRINYEKY